MGPLPVSADALSTRVVVGLIVAAALTAGSYATGDSNSANGTAAPASSQVESTPVPLATPVTDPATSASGTATSAVTAPPTTATTTNPAPPATMTAIAGEGENPPKFPEVVDGYVPDGDTTTGEVRIFGGSRIALIDDFELSMNNCGLTYWVLRWRSTGSSSRSIVVSRGFFADGAQVVWSDFSDIGAPGGRRGYVTGHQCSQPLFGDVPGAPETSEIADVVYEFQRYRRSVDGSDPPFEESPLQTSPLPPAPSCADYPTFYSGFPVTPCVGGMAVYAIQSRLNELGYQVDENGNYGPSTADAVARFQRDQGYVPDGVTGERTWSLLFSGAPPDVLSTDVNGDGQITPDEVVPGE